MPFLIFALLLSVFYPPVFFGILFLVLACLNWAIEFAWKMMIFFLASALVVGVVMGVMMIL